MGRVVGEGWELGVFREGWRLYMGIPVDSGFKNHAFEFDITARDLEVLERDAFRRRALDLILHEQLQPRLTRGDFSDAEAEVRPIIAKVLHGTDADVKAAIAGSRSPVFVRRLLANAGFENEINDADGL